MSTSACEVPGAARTATRQTVRIIARLRVIGRSIGLRTVTSSFDERGVSVRLCLESSVESDDSPQGVAWKFLG
jgi:hypothetical protein